MNRKAIAVHVLAVGGALGIGLALRAYSLPALNPAVRVQLQGAPILTTHDAYYYLRIARDYLTGRFQSGRPDRMRCAPNYEAYPSMMPMLSYLGALASRATGVDVDHVAFYLPALLSVLCVLPIYLIGLELSGPMVGYGGALLGVTFYVYLSRTGLGCFDTDCLHLFFLFSVAYGLLRSWRAGRDWRGYIWAGGAGGMMYLFYWWYDHPGFVWPFWAAFVLLLCVGKEHRGSWPGALVKVLLFSIVLGSAQWRDGWSAFVGFVRGAYVFPAAAIGIPSAAGSGWTILGFISSRTIGELRILSVWEILDTIHSVPVGAAGLVGLVCLILRTRHRFLTVLPILALGLLTFRSGIRFGLFLGPFVGMGLGFLADRGYVLLIQKHVVSRWVRIGATIALSMAVTAAGLSRASVGYSITPIAPYAVYQGLTALRALPSGFAWTWWDLGLMVQHVADKTTYADGRCIHRGYYTAQALAATDAEKCANFIRGFTSAGDSPLAPAVASGNDLPSVLGRFFTGGYNGKLDRPIYLVLTFDMLKKMSTIWRYGGRQGDSRSGESNLFGEFAPVKKRGPRLYCRDAIIDMKEGTIVFENQGEARFQKLYVQKQDGVPALYREYGRKDGYIAVFLESDKIVRFYLVHPDIFPTMTVQMLLMKNFDGRIFEPVYSDCPLIAIYRLK